MGNWGNYNPTCRDYNSMFWLVGTLEILVFRKNLMETNPPNYTRKKIPKIHLQHSPAPLSWHKRAHLPAVLVVAWGGNSNSLEAKKKGKHPPKTTTLSETNIAPENGPSKRKMDSLIFNGLC